MKLAGTSTPVARGRLIALAIIAVGIAALGYAAYRSSHYPATDDATIDADLVHVATPVGGRLLSLPVKENQHVAKGDTLFEIDPEPYRLTVRQAEADLAMAQASLETRRRALIVERANSSVADEQLRRAEANHALAARTVKRLAPLAAQGYVPTQQYDQSQVALRDAEVSLKQAQQQQAAAASTIGDEAEAQAAVQARQAALARARHSLGETVVRAPHDGYVTGLGVLSGETVAPGQSLFTLVASDEWFAVANFRETDLARISEGDCATVYSMIDRSQAMRGKVIGIGAGVLDGERINVPHALPLVQRSVNWVRVAQRFPVRVEIEEPPQKLVRMGASAMIEVRHGPACR
ncbi:multidrug transporter subunit MdtN [Achromobacter marplatensis]|uniref:Multidrug transporter subunit MdtN n=1 Tax=Achromobacter marplatensis TaxID=470868 RepID=A0AA42WAC8_9BURK|nr:multidrug transporter subunit MdtN [Achromobacter marplatensis]MDH2051614.1 multidrug transporter subunit MdtN [Achromobacter marplatensis]